MSRRAAPRTNLPVERGAFVGRGRTLEAISSLIERSDKRHVVVCGPEGIGKTRFALRAAARELQRFGRAGGVWFVECLDANDDSTWLRLLGLTMGLLPEPAADVERERERVVQVLRELGSALLVVDGADALAPRIDALVADLLVRCPQLRVVSTRRVAEESDAIAIVRLAALKVPRPGTAPRALLEHEAVELFLERVAEARGRRATSSPGYDDLIAVSRIVQQLEGNPAAIEFAAARCRVLSPGELLERLPRKWSTLTGHEGKRSALAGAVAWSLDLLAPWERAALAQCAIFHGGFTHAAAEAVLDLAQFAHAPGLAEVLDSLVDKALLRVMRAPNDDDGESPMRLTLPESVRDFVVSSRPAGTRTPRAAPATLEVPPGSLDAGAEARLELGIPRDELARRHASYILRVAGGLAEHVDGHGGLIARHRLEEEHDNLMAVVRRALSEDHATLHSATQALLGLQALEPVLTTRGPHELFVRLLDRALDAASKVGVPHAMLARTLEMRARARRARGQLNESRADLEQALISATRASEHANSVLAARARANLGTHLLLVGDLDGARDEYDRALHIVRALGDRRIEGRQIGFFGMLEEERGDAGAAERHYADALAIHRDVGDRRYEAIHGTQLGRALLAQRRVEDARDVLRRALVIHRELANKRLEGVTLALLGDAAVDDGDLDEAVSLWQRALHLHRAVGDAASVALTAARLAAAAPSVDDVDGETFTHESRSASAATDDPKARAGVLILLAATTSTATAPVTREPAGAVILAATRVKAAIRSVPWRPSP